LFKDIWCNSTAQKNGRRGQNQDGVDIYGQVLDGWVGVQCKQKDGLLRKTVTISELEEEVKAAHSFKPELCQFILTTTGRRDAKVQERARTLTVDNQSSGSFSVEVWSWQEIWAEFCRRKELFKKVGQQYWPHFYCDPIPSAHQLLPLPKLYGRDESLSELEKQIGNSEKWIGFQGMAGVGKTAFATALAHRLKKHYVNAQIFYDLRGADCEKRPLADPSDAMRFVIKSLKPTAVFPENNEDLAALYRSVLHDAGQVLLLFDNAADGDQVRPLLPPPNCLAMVTSRKFLNLSGLKMRKVECLKQNDSNKLLVELAPRTIGFESEISNPIFPRLTSQMGVSDLY
jgi:hypothetical protein